MLSLLFLISLLADSNAHSGGTDENGCHTDSSTGTRHCHNDSGSSSSDTSSSKSEPVDCSSVPVGMLPLVYILMLKRRKV